MSIVELKKELVCTIIESNDEDFLMNIQRTISNGDWYDSLPEKVKLRIEEGRQQIRNGKGIPEAEAKKMMVG